MSGQQNTNARKPFAILPTDLNTKNNQLQISLRKHTTDKSLQIFLLQQIIEVITICNLYLNLYQITERILRKEFRMSKILFKNITKDNG